MMTCVEMILIKSTTILGKKEFLLRIHSNLLEELPCTPIEFLVRWEYDRKYLGIHGVGDSLPNWHYEAFVAERYGDAEIGVLEGHAGLVVTAVQL